MTPSHSTAKSPSLSPTPAAPANCFEFRGLPNQVYDQLENDFCARPHDWLGSGEISINHHYHLIGRPPPHPGAWRRSTANRLTREEEELRVSVFGEMVGKAWGTRISSMGNFITGVTDNGIAKTINDGTSVRNKLFVRLPTFAPEMVEAAWDNQLSEIRDFEADVVKNNGACGNSIISYAPNNTTELIGVNMPQIYNDLCKGGPATKKSLAAAKPKTKQKVSISSMKRAKEELRSEAKKSANSGPSSNAAAGPSSAGMSSTPPSNPSDPGPRTSVELPLEWDQDAPVNGHAPAVSGATYNVNCLPDHRGPLFQHIHSVVQQPEVYNLQGELVNPRDLPFYLKPGVLLLLEGVFAVWHIPDGHSLVQFIADAIRVIADSDEPAQIPPIMPNTTSDKTSTKRTPEKRTAAFLHFGKGLPAKRAKVNTSSASTATAPVEAPLPTGVCDDTESGSELTEDEDEDEESDKDAEGEDDMDVAEEEAPRTTRSAKGKGCA